MRHMTVCTVLSCFTAFPCRLWRHRNKCSGIITRFWSVQWNYYVIIVLCSPSLSLYIQQKKTFRMPPDSNHFSSHANAVFWLRSSILLAALLSCPMVLAVFVDHYSRDKLSQILTAFLIIYIWLRFQFSGHTINRSMTGEVFVEHSLLRFPSCIILDADSIFLMKIIV